MEEAPSRFNTSPHGDAFDLYDHRRDLGNLGRARRRATSAAAASSSSPAGPTIGATARRWAWATGCAAQPHRALEPGLAGRILAAFLADRQRPIKEALLEGDLARARRLVNGGRHGLERFAAAYRTGDAMLRDPVWGAAPRADAA